MDSDVASQSQKYLVEDINSLKTQLSDLQERFDLIVNWIKSEYNDELIGLPDVIVYAVYGNPELPATVKTENIKIKREKLSPEEAETEHVDGLDTLKNPSINNETEREPDEMLINKLDEIFLKHITPLEDNCTIANLCYLQTNRPRRVKKTGKHLHENRAQKLIIDAFEYEEMISSLPSDRLTCVVCGKIFLIPQKRRRHELGVHLTKEDQTIFRNRENAVSIGTTKKVYNVERVKKRKVETAKIVSKCEICGLMIGVNNLKQHILTHRDIRNFLCNQCGKSFKRKHTLRMHEMAIHEKLRNQKCRYCEKTFVLRYVKEAHEKKHLGMSKVTCNLCGFSFTCPKNLKQHIRGVHENVRNYKCHLCDKSFKTSVARKYHLNTHGNPNGRKRGLNADVDPLKAAAKRRHCAAPNNYRVAEVAATMKTTLTKLQSKVEECS